ncbi:MAG: site-specific integrase [Ruminococcaceae bacterium]|nr:site-specific integrase [Oscillospiraceae bacterium]
MASIVQKNKSYYVVYSYHDKDGKRKQKWESFPNMTDAKKRLKEIEYKEQIGTFVVPRCNTLDELLKEYVDLYGKEKWSLSTYSAHIALIEHYIRPQIGSMKISDINTLIIDRYYKTLLKTKAVPKAGQKVSKKYLTPRTVYEIHKILRSCFNQAVKWEIMSKNPASNATVPKSESAKREIWTAETLFNALQLCEDPRLAMAMNLAFCCSLRMGELLGLTWDCIDISEESIRSGTPSVYVKKELQRVSRKGMNELDNKDVLQQFPTASAKSSTILVLKKPKTESSVRKVFMPVAVAQMLIEWKKTQDDTIEMLGSEYQNYNLVFAGPFGLPTEGSTITNALNRLIKEHDLPPVVFHSFRHASITYKLKMNGGDIKAVQGDSGHAQVKMITDVYSHILDDDRKNNAQLFQEAFYDRVPQQEQTPITLPEGITTETLVKMLQDPEIAALLGVLSKKL